MDAGSTEHEELPIQIRVNKDDFPWDRWTITGLEILDLAHESSSEYNVFIKRKGQHDDPVGLEEKVDLHDRDNRHFRTIIKEITEG